MRLIQILLLSLYLFAAVSGPLQAAPRVVASIKPLHSLVAGVMQDVATPELLLSGAESAHFFNLRPSAMRKMQHADLVFWIGENLELPLLRILPGLPEPQVQIALIETPGLVGKSASGKHDHGAHPGAKDHDKSVLSIDPHIWLSPFNTRVLVARIAEVLVQHDPAHAQTYRTNAERLDRRIRQLDTRLEKLLAGVKREPFVVYHDAYGYFERHYGLKSRAAITLSAERRPGARQVHNIEKIIREQPGLCVFSEPQFDPRLVTSLAQNNQARTRELDPIGVSFEAGPDAWFLLLENIAHTIHDCLSGN